MANVNRPNGLTPVGHLTGGLIRANVYTIAANYGTKLYSGQPVIMTGTGRNIAAAAADGAAIGVFAGCQYVDTLGEVQFRPFWPAPGAVATGTVVQAFVFDDPNIVFEVQADTLAEADVGQTYDFTIGSGSDTTGRAATIIADASKGSSQVVRVLGLVDRPDNAFGAYAKVEVVFNLHAYIARGTAI